MMAMLLSSLDTSIIVTALPTIAGQFNAFESFAWVGTAYIVTSTIATPLLGKLSDLYGRRKIFQLTMVMFLLGSILCGAAQSMNQLIAARAVQGLGGGGINRQQPDRTGFLVDFDAEFGARLQTHAPGVGMANQQVAIAMDAGAELGLASLGARSRLTSMGGLGGQGVALGQD